MSTLKQIEANRLNSQKSTGPRSVEGKSVSRMNALKTGIDAQSEIIRGEDPAALEALTTEYLERFQPATPEERDLVDTAVASVWQLRRFRKVEAAIWEKQFRYFERYKETDGTVGDAFCHNDTVFGRLQRRVEVTNRIYNATLDKLKALQRERGVSGADDRCLSSAGPLEPELASFPQPCPEAGEPSELVPETTQDFGPAGLHKSS